MSVSASAEAGRAAPAAASGKRRAYRSVQEARERLTYKSGGKPEFEYELLLMFVRNELSAAVTTPLLAIIVAMGAMFALPVYLQPMAEDTGWTRAGISSAMTVGFIVMGIAGFAWGTLSDRIGARPVVLMAAVLLGGGLLLASTAHDLLVFQFAYGGLVGASGGAFFAPIMSATLGWFDKHRSLAVSLVSVGIGVAPMTVAPFAQWLVSTYGWRESQFIMGVALLVLLVPMALLIRRPPAVPVKLPSDLLERRPDVALAERTVQAQSAQIGVAVAAFYPTVTLSASGGIAGDPARTFFSAANTFWSVAASGSRSLTAR